MREHSPVLPQITYQPFTDCFVFYVPTRQVYPAAIACSATTLHTMQSVCARALARYLSIYITKTSVTGSCSACYPVLRTVACRTCSHMFVRDTLQALVVDTLPSTDGFKLSLPAAQRTRFLPSLSVIVTLPYVASTDYFMQCLDTVTVQLQAVKSRVEGRDRANKADRRTVFDLQCIVGTGQCMIPPGRHSIRQSVNEVG